MLPARYRSHLCPCKQQTASLFLTKHPSLTNKQMLAEQTTVTQINGLRAYQGGFFRVLVSPEQTDGSLAIIDITLPKGSEPPRHMHTREDETFYIIDGSVQFEIGDTVIDGKVGQAVFAPRY